MTSLRGSDPPDLVTMPLLEKLTVQSLDQDYQVAADRRRRFPDPNKRPRRRFRPATAAAVAVFGLIIAVAAVQTWRQAPDSANDREALVQQIVQEKDTAATDQRELRRLRQQTTSLQSGLQTITGTAAAAESRLRRLGVRTGYAATSGQGVRIRTDDSRDGSDDGRIRDEDLAMLVDGLWSAGARAVSINGIRLTALSPIRTSGVAIHVAFRPISPPYTVLALGETATLQARFAESTHGLGWLSRVNAFGYRFEMQNEGDLSLPAASGPVLHAVRADLSPESDEPGPTKETSP